jgi:hypothetical protein
MDNANLLEYEATHLYKYSERSKEYRNAFTLPLSALMYINIAQMPPYSRAYFLNLQTVTGDEHRQYSPRTEEQSQSLLRKRTDINSDKQNLQRGSENIG